jgi:hypothetical protein
MGYDEFGRGQQVRVGDCNGSGSVDISDAVEILAVLFHGAGMPACLEACDADRVGGVDLTDAIGVLRSLFGSPLAAGGLPDFNRCRFVEPGSSCATSSCP